jgi:menaquinone-dependent protoporphyrinogen oxidase
MGVEMQLLVAYASKHGATEGIAEHVAATLRGAGVDVVTQRADRVEDAAAYDALVVGSAVYYGSWLQEAADFVRGNRAVLAERPTWLFSSGPLGEHVTDDEEQPKEIAEFREAVSPRDHRTFLGALDRSRLPFPERMVAKAVRAPEGDFRDWAAIAAWAEGIARQLREQPAPSRGRGA